MLLQPGRNAGLKGESDPVRSPVFRQQQQSRFGTVIIEGRFKRGKGFQQLGLQAVDRPDPVRGLVGTPGGEDSQARAGFVPGMLAAAVTVHAGLVRDDGGVFGICFAFPPVQLGGAVLGPDRDVEDVLAVADEQGNQQRQSAVIQIRRPGHFISAGELQDVGDEVASRAGSSLAIFCEIRRFSSPSITTQ